MSMTPNQKQLADRILKLLALANSTTFAAEAQTARRLAEELMKAHNVDIKPGKPGQDAIEVRTYVPFAKGLRWEGIIVDTLADLCSCAMFFDKDKLDEYTLVGAVGNLDMLDYMVREVNRQRIAAWLKYKGSAGPDSFNKFCYGFAQALKDKIDAIVVYEVKKKQSAELISWYEVNALGRSVRSAKLSSGPASSEAGMEAGKSASLHRGALGQSQRQVGYNKRIGR
jgi:hypothetical protein